MLFLFLFFGTEKRERRLLACREPTGAMVCSSALAWSIARCEQRLASGRWTCCRCAHATSTAFDSRCLTHGSSGKCPPLCRVAPIPAPSSRRVFLIAHGRSVTSCALSCVVFRRAADIAACDRRPWVDTPGTRGLNRFTIAVCCRDNKDPRGQGPHQTRKNR